ncbi:hypothetical protein GLW20_06250 [Virgibacillus halodenitrificans]|nr:hypothetical protein [Virgibacillus halodenitrificans]
MPIIAWDFLLKLVGGLLDADVFDIETSAAIKMKLVSLPYFKTVALFLSYTCFSIFKPN